MEPETTAEETLEEDVRLNESFYIIRPHSDSELAQCHGFNLKKDFEVRTDCSFSTQFTEKSYSSTFVKILLIFTVMIS